METGYTYPTRVGPYALRLTKERKNVFVEKKERNKKMQKMRVIDRRSLIMRYEPLYKIIKKKKKLSLKKQLSSFMYFENILQLFYAMHYGCIGTAGVLMLFKNI